MFQIQILFYLPELVGVLLIIALILLSGKSGRSGLIIVPAMTLLFLWLAFQLLAQTVPDGAISLIFVRLSLATSLALSLVYLYTILRYTRKRMFTPVTIALAGLVVGLDAITVAGTTVYDATSNLDGIVINQAGSLYFVGLLVTLAIFGYALILLWIESRHAGPIDRPKHRLLFAATIQMVLVNGIGSIIFATYAAAQILTFLSALVFCIIIFFGIVRHSLFDVRLVIVRTLGYVLSLVSLAVIYIIMAFLLSLLFFKSNFTNEISFSPINIVLALIMAFIFQPVKGFFDRITNRIFFREHYSTEDFYGSVSNVLSATTDLKSLLEQASDTISATLKSGQAFFYVRHGGKHVSAGTNGHSSFISHEAKKLDHVFGKQRSGVVSVDSVSRQREIYPMLARKRIELLLPLWHDGQVMGYFALGDALGTRYTTRDMRVLDTIADELVIAIQNALSLEQVREVNASLQDRIDTATRSLRITNDKLRKLDDTKDEFISMASHQLRTPLTSVKGYISMILDGDAGDINPQQRRFLTEAFESSNRMAGIIGDFLNVSRLQTGKFGLEREVVDLAEVIESEIEHLENTAGSRGLKLKFHKPKDFPAMRLDKSKIEQVVMNFIDNAIFYAPNTGSVDIELYERAGKAVFTVRDHGIGVPKGERANLFTKFFRATNARQKRPDGTGVGLFLAKKVIVAHKGTVIFDSHEGEGSIFGFEIPITPVAVAPASSKAELISRA